MSSTLKNPVDLYLGPKVQVYMNVYLLSILNILIVEAIKCKLLNKHGVIKPYTVLRLLYPLLR